MITDITYPDYEMRLAIIKNKLQERRANLQDEVCELIARKIQRNIREIEGILNKIIFYQEVKTLSRRLRRWRKLSTILSSNHRKT